ncbi:MAG: ABC transporter permease [Rhodocyclaceae bacterium]|nr:ABC transporter permease [Rhodocyclaceae bacterium]
MPATAHSFRPPSLSWRFASVWSRNYRVWRKLAAPSLLGNLADPMIYLLGLGYGLGALVETVDGVPYVHFLAAGMVCFSCMNTASFETLYSAFSRMHVQRTWEGLMNAPLALDDIVLAEMIWAASKATLSGCAILLVVALFGFTHSALALGAVPLIFLIGLCFAAMGLVVTALAPSYDFFMYYFTLFITPMALLSGVFFPLDQLPASLQAAAQLLPLSHAIAIARPLMLGHAPTGVALHAAVLAAYAAVAFWLAVSLTRRRLLK